MKESDSIVAQRAMLSELSLEVSYRSDMGSIVDLFYIPCLERACAYRRAVGYFTGSGLAAAARGIASFIRGKGRMYLVASPYLNEEDARAIAQGYEARHNVVTRALLSGLSRNFDEIVENRLACLAWLVAHDRLEIKIALPKKLNTGTRSIGIYHEKLGIFEDDQGNQVAFSGSANETAGGLIDNFEAIDVFWSWEDYQGRVSRKAHNFRELWENTTTNLDVFTFPDAVRKRLLEFRRYPPPVVDPESSQYSSSARSARHTKHFFSPPAHIQVRDYQRLAVEEWCKNKSRGIFEMATGTGKTITALLAAHRMFLEQSALGIVVLTPFQHLVDQWDDECRAFGLVPLKCYESSSSWHDVLIDQITDLNIGARTVIAVITTHTTASQEQFGRAIARMQKPVLLIGDEVHHLGAPEFSKAMAPVAEYRLGLSATPVRWLDSIGNRLISDYFGPPVFSFPLDEAIAQGFLCHYDYFPHLCPLTEEEVEHYLEISAKIARIWKLAERDEGILQNRNFLLRERARILNCAESKLPTLRQLISQPEQLHHTLFYCAPQQIDAVVNLLARHFHIRVRRFTAEETPRERRDLLDSFEKGDLQGLVAMKCLDEGVDVPATQTAYILASSSNPREFIQRRGRILRLHPLKKRAAIHDLIAAPPKQDRPGDHERNMVRRELARFKEFASAADNEYVATAKILELARSFHVLDF